MAEIQKIIESLSPLERKIIPFLNLSLEEIKEKTKLDQTSLMRALKFLENKNIISLNYKKKKIIELGTNGIYYRKNHLPERKLITLVEENNHIQLQEAKKQSKLSENEFKVSLGVLKNKSLIEIKNGKLSINASKEILSRKTPEEQLLEILPIEETALNEEQLFVLKRLQSRKEIIQIEEKITTSFQLTDFGKQLAGKKIELDLLEDVTPKIIENWKKGTKFRHYDIKSSVPKLYAGKKHFVNESIEYAKRIWLDLGFKEMTGSFIQTSFWNFDVLFTAQDHPVRDMHDTFFIKDVEGQLPEKKITMKIKEAHESGIDNSKGWNYEWAEEEAKKIVLRTHTTCLSAQKLSSLKKENLPAKFFAIGKVFRNETVDWSHGFEFYQTEGIVIDENLTMGDLLGYLTIFYKKMGFEKVRFTPAYFPYTEPSVETSVFHPEKKVWLELGGAGLFRPEVTIPLLGSKIPVLAWGQGFDRIITDYYKIKDLREMYENHICKLRTVRAWMK